MKKCCAALAVVLAMLSAMPAAADEPCGAICQAYSSCDTPCDVCEGDPGLWEVDGGCWGERRTTNCGEFGQCGWTPPPNCQPNWSYDEWASYQGARPELQWDPRCEWVFYDGEWHYVCDYDNPWKCTVYGVYRFVRHQDNCQPPSSETFCLIDNGGSQQTVGWYPAYWPDQCCWDSNQYGCSTYFPNCPNL